MWHLGSDCSHELPRRRRSTTRLRLEPLEQRAMLSVLPAGFSESLVAGAMSSPTAMEFAPDGRIFVTQQTGAVRVIKNGALLPTPFATLSVDPNGERGLLGIAFDPNFANNQFVYLYYTTLTAPVHNRISRFTANGDVAVPGSEVVLLDLDNLSAATNHNGGAIHFGKDGKLYAGVGENATRANAQTLGNLLGKMLRINSDGSIPEDNPFYNTATGKNRAIWALGLRNPFTFAVQPGTGRLFINDVGEVTWEEINDGIAGSNYGWPTNEGIPANPNPNFRDPLFAYPHSGANDLSGIAIAGGAFYNAPIGQFPAEYAGDYFFADFGHNWIRRYDPVSNVTTAFASGISGATTDLKVGADGSLYYLSGARSNNGAVRRITFPSAVTVSQDPVPQAVLVGQSATFSVGVSGSPAITYQWLRDGANIPGATGPTYTLSPAATGDNGARFSVRVTNPLGNATSQQALLTVTPLTSIAGRHLFYNNSVFDSGPGGDDVAIATDKAALRPGQVAGFANYSSYDLGINGVMVDVAQPGHTPTLGDFAFRMGTDNNFAAWSAAPTPTLEVRPGAGVNNSTRVTLIWPDDSLEKVWLEVSVLPSLGLAAADVFYFGNAVGESGGPSVGKAIVDANDEISARQNPRTFRDPAVITDLYDYNRDGFVNAADQIFARSNAATFDTAIDMIAPGPSPLSQSMDAMSLDAVSAAVAAALAADRTLLSPEPSPLVQPAFVPTRSTIAAGDAEFVGAAIAGHAEHSTKVTSSALPRRRPLDRNAAGQLGPPAMSVLHL